MTGPINEVMLDRGRVSVGTLVTVAAACIGAAIAWQDVKSEIAAQAKADLARDERIDKLQQDHEADSETLAAICEKLQCRAKGIRK